MSWRKFQVLMKCLSSQSHTVQRLQSDSYIGSKNGEPVVAVEGKANVDRVFENLFAK